MKAIILAAGQGQRLHPLTRTTHKGLLEVGGRTLLGRLVEGLVACDVREVIVVTGHCADAVGAHLLGDYPHVRFELVHNPDFASSNNIVSLALAIAHARGHDVLLAECDVVLDDSLLDLLVAGPGDLALVDLHRDELHGSVVELAADGESIARFLPHAREDSLAYKTINLYRLSAAFVEALSARLAAAARARPNAFYETVFAEMVAEVVAEPRPMRALVAAPHRWIEIDTYADLLEAERTFGKREP